jgi:putative flippase GtrA
VKNTLKKHADKFRFGVVGVANTVIDFSVLFLLVSLGLNAVLGNFISTSIALIFSYFANKKYTFRDLEKGSKKQFAYFLAITLFGLWIIQPIIIEGTSLILNSLKLNSYVLLFAGKLLATIVSLVWNYLMYRRFVFKRINS